MYCRLCYYVCNTLFFVMFVTLYPTDEHLHRHGNCHSNEIQLYLLRARKAATHVSMCASRCLAQSSYILTHLVFISSLHVPCTAFAYTTQADTICRLWITNETNKMEAEMFSRCVCICCEPKLVQSTHFFTWTTGNYDNFNVKCRNLAWFESFDFRIWRREVRWRPIFLFGIW